MADNRSKKIRTQENSSPPLKPRFCVLNQNILLNDPIQSDRVKTQDPLLCTKFEFGIYLVCLAEARVVAERRINEKSYKKAAVAIEKSIEDLDPYKNPSHANGGSVAWEGTMGFYESKMKLKSQPLKSTWITLSRTEAVRRNNYTDNSRNIAKVIPSLNRGMGMFRIGGKTIRGPIIKYKEIGSKLRILVSLDWCQGPAYPVMLPLPAQRHIATKLALFLCGIKTERFSKEGGKNKLQCIDVSHLLSRLGITTNRKPTLDTNLNTVNEWRARNGLPGYRPIENNDRTKIRFVENGDVDPVPEKKEKKMKRVKAVIPETLIKNIESVPEPSIQNYTAKDIAQDLIKQFQDNKLTATFVMEHINGVDIELPSRLLRVYEEECAERGIPTTAFKRSDSAKTPLLNAPTTAFKRSQTRKTPLLNATNW